MREYAKEKEPERKRERERGEREARDESVVLARAHD